MKKLLIILIGVMTLNLSVVAYAEQSTDNKDLQKEEVIDFQKAIKTRLGNYKAISNDTTVYDYSFSSLGELHAEVKIKGKVITPSHSDVMQFQKSIMKKIKDIDKEIKTFCQNESEKNKIYSNIIDVFSNAKTIFQYSQEPITLKMDCKSLEEVLDAIDSNFSWAKALIENDREALTAFKYDLPSIEYRTDIGEAIIDNKVPEKFQKDFDRNITIGEYSQLVYESIKDDIYIDRFIIKEPSIKHTYPDYVKLAYIFGFIDKYSDLDKMLTREEMAHIIASVNGCFSKCNAFDYNKINPEYLINASNDNMSYINHKFEPKQYYKLENAIVDVDNFHCYNYYIRGIFPSEYLMSSAKITLEGNLIVLDEIRDFDYIKDIFTKKIVEIDFNLSTKMVDYGAFYVDFDVKKSKISIFAKEGCRIYLNKNFKDRNYYLINHSIINKYEPKAVDKKSKFEKITKGDSANQEIRRKVKEIINKIINPKMTDEEKVKAIHDYVAKTITYSGEYGFTTTEVALHALNTGKGVCVAYATLFDYLCDEAGISSLILSDRYTFVGSHSWNAVYINDRWYHVDVTCDDAKNSIVYTYFMKTPLEVMRTHGWEQLGSIQSCNYQNTDPMNIQSTEELRLYLLDSVGRSEVNSYDYDIRFKLANKGIDLDLGFLKNMEFNYGLSLDEITNVYTLYRIKK
ncbi:hypothetical protein AN1V17_32070 [Vallitalea sediminicola]